MEEKQLTYGEIEKNNPFAGQKPLMGTPTGGNLGTNIVTPSGGIISSNPLENNAIELGREKDVEKARIGDYYISGGVAKVVPDSLTDVSQKYRSVSGASPVKNLSLTDIGSAVLDAFGTRQLSKIGLSQLGAATTPAGAAVSAAVSELRFFDSLGKAYARNVDEFLNQQVGVDYAFDIVDKDGVKKAVLKTDAMDTAGYGSGEGVRNLTNTEATSVKLNNGGLDISVSPVFAASDKYSDIVEDLKEKFPDGITEEMAASQVYDDETGTTLLEYINKYVAAEEDSFFYKAQSVRRFKQIAPSASADSLSEACATQLAGSLEESALKKVEITIFDDENQKKTVNAYEYLKTISDMSDTERNDYMLRIGNRISDPNISDDERVILQAQANALYMASDAEKGEFKGMYEKSFLDSVADVRGWLSGARLGDIAFGISPDLETFETNEVYAPLLNTANGIMETIAFIKSTAKIGKTIGSAVSRVGAKTGLDWLENVGQRYSIDPNVSGVKDRLKEAGRAALSQTGQFAVDVAADVAFDSMRAAAHTIAQENYDFFKELKQDVLLDAIISYGPGAFVDAVNMGKLEYEKVGDDVKLVERTANEVAAKRAATMDKITDSNALLKTEELFFDKNAAMSKVAVQVRKNAPENTDLYHRTLNMAGDIRQLAKDELARFMSSSEGVKAHYDDYNKAIAEAFPSPRDYTDADARYMNAAANQYRFEQEFKGDRSGLIKVHKKYKGAINGVSKERAEQLDGLMTAMRNVYSDMFAYYKERGLISEEEYSRIVSGPSYANNMYFPVWVKDRKYSDSNMVVPQTRNVKKEVIDPEDLIDIERFEDPLITFSRYTDAVMRNIAVNERKLAMREAASLAGMNTRIVKDTGGAMKDAELLKKTSDGFQKIYDGIVKDVEKQIPTHEEYSNSNQRAIKRSGAQKTISELDSLQRETRDLNNRLRRERRAVQKAGGAIDFSEMQGISDDEYYAGLAERLGSDVAEKARARFESSQIKVDGAKIRAADLNSIKIYQNNPFYAQAARSIISGGAVDKNLLPETKSLINAVHGNSKKRNKLYRLEKSSGQIYKKGAIAPMPLTSFSKSKDIFTKEGRFITTGMYEPGASYFVIEIEPGKYGSLDISDIALKKEQQEVLVSDNFRVKEVSKIDGKVGDVEADSITRVVLEPAEGVEKLYGDIDQTRFEIAQARVRQAELVNKLPAEVKRLMMGAQKRNTWSPVALDIDSYLNVNFANDIRAALRENNSIGSMQTAVNKAVEAASPYISRETVIAERAGKSAERYRKRLMKELPKDGESKIDSALEALVEKFNLSPRVYDKNNRSVTYMLNGNRERMVFDGPGAELLAKELEAPEFIAPKTVGEKALRNLRGVGASFARTKRFLTSMADVARVAPNLARDIVRGTVTTGGQILLSPDDLRREVIENGNYTPEQIEKIERGFALAREAISQSTFTKSLEVPKKNRSKSLIKAAHEATAGNSFEKYVWNFKNKSLVEKASVLSDAAEEFTRKRAMDTAYYREIQKRTAAGESIDDAIKAATEAAYFHGREATTNFFRRGSYIAKIAEQVPYLSQRFASLESLKYEYINNPLALTRSLRAVVGSSAAVLALTLSNDESRKRYFLLTEAERANNIIIPVDNGLILKVPLDDNLAAFLTPYRRMIETLNGVDPEAFYLWGAEFLSALSPLDMTGFSEGDKFNVMRGFQKLGNEFIPTWALPVLENMQGYDFYYGSRIRIDADYTDAYYGIADPTPGQMTTKSKNSHILAGIADALGMPQWKLQNYVETYGGNVGQYVLNIGDKLVGATEEAQGGKEFFDSIFKPFTGAESNAAQSAMWDGINQLNTEKEKLQREIKDLNNKIAAATGDEKAQLQERRQEKIKSYGLRVSDFLDQYLSAYEITGGLTKAEANRIWYLYDIYGDASNASEYSDDSIENYYNTKIRKQKNKRATNLAAISGFDKYVNTALGNYYDTYGKQAFENSIYGQGTQTMAKIAMALEDTTDYDNSLTKMRKDVYDARSKAFDAQNYDLADAIAYEYDYQVLKAALPYLQEAGLEQSLNNSTVMDYLKDWIIVPSEEMVTARGGYLSKLPSETEKGEAFKKRFIKKMYGVLKDGE